MRPLNERQIKFVEVYAETGNAVTAYKEAGYLWQRDGQPQSWLTAKAGELALRPNVHAAIERIKTERTRQNDAQTLFTIDFIRAKHVELFKECRQVGDMTNATRNLEALGRTVGAYSDNLIIDAGKVREFSEREQLEAQRLARLMLTGDVIEAEPMPNTDSDVRSGRVTDGNEPVNAPETPITETEQLEPIQQAEAITEPLDEVSGQPGEDDSSEIPQAPPHDPQPAPPVESISPPSDSIDFKTDFATPSKTDIHSAAVSAIEAMTEAVDA